MAWGVAIGHPQRLERLVMINSPHPYLFWRELVNNPAQQKASEYMNVFRLPKAERVLSENNYARLLDRVRPPRAGLVARNWCRPGRSPARSPAGSITTAPRRCIRRTAAIRAPKKLQLKAEDFMVRVPTLVLWGERDTALLTGCLEGLGECVPDLKVLRVPDASHWIVHEKPELVCGEIEKFVREAHG